MWTVLLVSFAVGRGDVGVGDVSFSSADFGDDAKDLELRVQHAIPPSRHLRLLLPSDEQEPTVGYGLVPPCVVAMARGLTATNGRRAR